MPAASSAVAWTNTSLPPFSGVMNPKPLAVLKNFTVPVTRMWDVPFPIERESAGQKRAARSARHLRLGKANRPYGQAAKPQILRRAPSWSAPAGPLYGAGLRLRQDTSERTAAVMPATPARIQVVQALAGLAKDGSARCWRSIS